jgi:hypothetical protein
VERCRCLLLQSVCLAFGADYFEGRNEVIQPSVAVPFILPASIPSRDDPISLGVFSDVDDGAAVVGQVVCF